jgi:hypothetical protein
MKIPRIGTIYRYAPVIGDRLYDTGLRAGDHVRAIPVPGMRGTARPPRFQHVERVSDRLVTMVYRASLERIDR